MEVDGELFVCPMKHKRNFANIAVVTLQTECNAVADFEHAWEKESLHSIANITRIILIYNNPVLQRHGGTPHAITSAVV